MRPQQLFLLLTLIPVSVNRQGRNSSTSWIYMLHYPPDGITWCLFSHFHQALRSFRQNKCKETFLLFCSYHQFNPTFSLCFSLASFPLPSFSTTGQLFMVLHLVILPLYCFLSELLSRIRQLAYHRDMIYRIYKQHSPCGTALILFDFGKTSRSQYFPARRIKVLDQWFRERVLAKTSHSYCAPVPAF